MSVALLLIDDGRADYLRRCELAIAENLPSVRHRVLVDDSDHELGFAGAVQEGWRRVVAATDADWVFHLESDFILTSFVPLRQMIALLERHPHLAQVSLKRQPVNDRECAAGGIVEADPDDFHECFDGEATYTEHRRYMTTNPSVYSSSLCSMGWPQEPESEGVFTHQLLADRDLHFAIWGAKFDPPRVLHIGEARAGIGY